MFDLEDTVVVTLPDCDPKYNLARSTYSLDQILFLSFCVTSTSELLKNDRSVLPVCSSSELSDNDTEDMASSSVSDSDEDSGGGGALDFGDLVVCCFSLLLELDLNLAGRFVPERRGLADADGCLGVADSP